MGNNKKHNKADEENAALASMMDDIVDRVEAGEVTQASIDAAEAARNADVISWGSGDGVVIGTLADETSVDANGNALDVEV